MYFFEFSGGQEKMCCAWWHNAAIVIFDLNPTYVILLLSRGLWPDLFVYFCERLTLNFSIMSSTAIVWWGSMFIGCFLGLVNTKYRYQVVPVLSTVYLVLLSVVYVVKNIFTSVCSVY